MGTAAAVTDSCCNMLEAALSACSPRFWVARGAAGRRVVRSHPDPSDRSCSWSHARSSMWPFALVPALVPTTLPLRALWPRGASARGAAGWASPSKNSHAFSSCSLGWSELKTARPDKSTLWMDMAVRPRRGTGFLGLPPHRLGGNAGDPFLPSHSFPGVKLNRNPVCSHKTQYNIYTGSGVA